MKFVVTGGCGFIGSHIVDALIARGDEVHIVDTFRTGKRERLNLNAVLHEIDIRDAEKLLEIFVGSSGIFHTAAEPRMQYSINDPRLTHDINVTGTLNVLLAARDCNVPKVVYSASTSAYGLAHTMPLTEDMTPNPLIPYAIQKYVGEKYCEMASALYGVATVSLRYFNVYGPHQTTDSDGPYATVVGIFLGQRKKNMPMTVVLPGTQRRDFVHVSDVVNANLLAMASNKAQKGEVINIGTGISYGMIEVAKLIGGPMVFIGERKGDVTDSVANIIRAKKMLDWEPHVAFEKGIDELKQFYGL